MRTSKYIRSGGGVGRQAHVRKRRQSRDHPGRGALKNGGDGGGLSALFNLVYTKGGTSKKYL